MDGKVYLIGFSGSGKSHLAPLLARQLKIPRYDTDAMIEKHSGVSISRLFATHGEKHFRNLEADQIERLANDPNPAVVALGGGALMDPTVRRLVQASGIVIYLSCSVEVLYRRLREKHDRPLLATKPKLGETPAQATKRQIRELLSKRKSVYRQADITVSTSRRPPTETVDRICERIKQHYA